jgi:phage FluMu protein Com
MINFQCPHCSQKVKANDVYAGKQVKCPKCGQAIRIPSAAEQLPAEQPDVIKFRCPGCNQKIGLSKEYAGKTVKCAKCKQLIQVPADKAQQAASQPDIKSILRPKPAPSEPADAFGAGDVPGDNLFDEQLLAAEANAPAADESLKLSSTPSQEQASTQKRCPRCGEMNPVGAQICGICAFELSASSPRAEKQASSPKRTFVVAGICGMSILLLVIVVLMILPSFRNLKPKKGPRADEAKQLAEQFVNFLVAGDAASAKNLLAPATKSDANSERMEQFTKLIGKNKVSDANLGLTHYEAAPEGDKYYLSYNTNSNDGEKYSFCTLIFSLREAGSEFKIDGVAAENSDDETTLSIGPRNYEELSTIIFTPAISGLGQALARSCCAIMVVIIFVALVQIISMWVIFNKAGQPGWAAIVPFYNMWVLAEVGEKSGWMGLAACFSGAIPYVGFIISIVFSIIINIGVAKTFSRGVLFGLGLVFLPFIFYPILAFATD